MRRWTITASPPGYTKTPVEVINYCSVHDNQDLFDAVQLKSSAKRTVLPHVRAGRFWR